MFRYIYCNWLWQQQRIHWLVMSQVKRGCLQTLKDYRDNNPFLFTLSAVLLKYQWSPHSLTRFPSVKYMQQNACENLVSYSQEQFSKDNCHTHTAYCDFPKLTFFLEKCMMIITFFCYLSEIVPPPLSIIELVVYLSCFSETSWSQWVHAQFWKSGKNLVSDKPLSDLKKKVWQAKESNFPM